MALTRVCLCVALLALNCIYLVSPKVVAENLAMYIPVMGRGAQCHRKGKWNNINKGVNYIINDHIKNNFWLGQGQDIGMGLKVILFNLFHYIGLLQDIE